MGFRVPVGVLVGLIAVVVVAGCGGGGAAAGDGGAGPIKIGASISLTGDFAPDGKLVRDGYELWADRVNERGGLDVGGTKRRVELVFKDDGSDRDQAVRLADSLITQDRVDFMFAPWGSGETSAVAPIAERNQVVMIAPEAAADDIWGQGYRWLFGILPLGSRSVWAQIDLAKEMGLERVAVIASNDTFPLASAKGGAQHVKDIGLQLVDQETYPPGANDVGSVLTRVMAKHPQVVVNTADTQDAVTFLQAMQQRRFEPELIIFAGPPSEPDFRKAAGPLAEGVVGDAFWSKDLPYEDELFGTAKAFYKHASDTLGYPIPFDVAAAAAAGEALGLAIEQAGTLDPEKVRDALDQLDANTFYGRIHFADAGYNDGYPTKGGAVAVQVQNDQVPVVYPQNVATAKPRTTPQQRNRTNK